MNTLTFSISINVSQSIIWKALWIEENYRKWAAIFFEGSYIVVNDWKVGSTVHFLGDGQNGIFSEIESYTPKEFVKFRHIGNVIEGKEQPINEETKKWSGATESYAVSKDQNGINTLTLTLNVMDEHLEFMNEKTPKALDVIRNMSEGVSTPLNAHREN